MDLKEKLLLDWQVVFPGASVPDLNFVTSKAGIEDEIQKCKDRLEELKFSIAKEEFLLAKLNEIKGQNHSAETPSGETLSINNEPSIDDFASPNTAIDDFASLDTAIDKDDNEHWPPAPTSLTSNEEELHSIEPKINIEEFSDNETKETIVLDEKASDNTEKSDVDVTSIDATCFSTFQPVNKQGERLKTSQTSLNEMFDNDSSDEVSLDKRRFSGVKTYQKAYSVENQHFDFTMGRPLARRLTDPYPKSPTDDPIPKPRPAPRSLPRPKKKPLPPLPKRPSVVKKAEQNESNNMPMLPARQSVDNDEVFVHINVNTKDESSLNDEKDKNITDVFEKRSESDEKDESYFKDDEHIYTDINELNIIRRNVSDIKECLSSDSEDEQIYENANMLPRLEPLVDNSSTGEMKVTKHLKRLGSEDRQAIVINDDIDINAVKETDMHTVKDLEAILNGSRESLVDDLDDRTTNAPDIVIENQYDDGYRINSGDYDDDDDEHIYANVDDLRISSKQSDDDSGSDDPLADSVSMGLPSPLYTEMTPDQIQSMLQKIQSNASDQSQDESDDELHPLQNTERNKEYKKKLSGSSSVEPKSAARNISSVERTISTPIPETQIVEKEKKSPEETEEEKQHLKASRMRNLLVHNLLDSEKCYLDCLEMLFKFMKPLKKSTESSQPILSKADYENIFHKAEELFNLHREFYEHLEPRVENWNDGQLIGDLFTMIMHSFDVYLGYIGNYKVAMETVLKCRHANQYFASIMDQDIRIVSLKDPLKMEGLLYKPVDRMTQYSLILNISSVLLLLIAVRSFILTWMKFIVNIIDDFMILLNCVF